MIAPCSNACPSWSRRFRHLQNPAIIMQSPCSKELMNSVCAKYPVFLDFNHLKSCALIELLFAYSRVPNTFSGCDKHVLHHRTKSFQSRLDIFLMFPKRQRLRWCFTETLSHHLGNFFADNLRLSIDP